MYILMTDETNVTESETVKFFIYGGLILHADKLQPLTEAIEAIRIEYGLKAGDPLKFDTRARPEHVSIEDYTAAKGRVIEVCAALGTEFVSYMILHKIAKEDKSVLVGYGLNTIISVFNFTYLEEHDAHGVVVVDRLPFKQDYDFLKGKFSVGLLMDDGRQLRLNRIDLFASSCDGASHLSSAVDIVLGAFRFCVNYPDSEVSKKIFGKVAGMLYHKLKGDTHLIRERGLTMRPKEIKVATYQQEYDDVVARLVKLAMDSED